MASSIPKTMQAWVQQIGKGEPIRKQWPVPQPSLNGLLVKVFAMGVCHSDCTMLDMKEPMRGMKSEFVLGHEGCGEIVQLGPEVDESKFAVGDKVAILICPGCDQPSCPDCSRGLHRLCRAPASGNYGLGVSDGVFAEYIAITTRAAFKLPVGVDIAEAAVSADAVFTAYHAVRYTANVQPDQTIAIFGLGGVGLNGLQTALHLGAKRILVVDKRQSTIDEAIKLGIAKEDTFCTGDSSAKRIEQYVAENEIYIDTTLDFVGHAETVQSAQFTVRPGGTMVIVGILSPSVSLSPVVCVVKAVTIKCAYSGVREAFPECLELMAKGVLKPSVETTSVEDLPKVLKDLDEGKIKSRMVLLPDWRKQDSAAL